MLLSSIAIEIKILLIDQVLDHFVLPPLYGWIDLVFVDPGGV
jgi:hypothetical protein